MRVAQPIFPRSTGQALRAARLHTDAVQPFQKVGVVLAGLERAAVQVQRAVPAPWTMLLALRVPLCSLTAGQPPTRGRRQGGECVTFSRLLLETLSHLQRDTRHGV